MQSKLLLVDVTQSLRECRTEDEVLSKGLAFLGQHLRNNNIAVHLYEPLRKSFYPFTMNRQSVFSESAWREIHNEVKLDYDQDLLFREVMQTKQAIFIKEIEKDSRPNHDVCKRFGISGVFMLPLVGKVDIMGVFAVANLEDEWSFSELDIKVAQAIVDITSLNLALLKSAS
jgi:hypothetical protein